MTMKVCKYCGSEYEEMTPCDSSFAIKLGANVDMNFYPCEGLQGHAGFHFAEIDNVRYLWSKE